MHFHQLIDNIPGHFLRCNLRCNQYLILIKIFSLSISYHIFFKEFHITLLLTGLIFSNQHNNKNRENLKSKHIKLELRKMQDNQNFQSLNPQRNCNLPDLLFQINIINKNKKTQTLAFKFIKKLPEHN